MLQSLISVRGVKEKTESQIDPVDENYVASKKLSIKIHTVCAYKHHAAATTRVPTIEFRDAFVDARGRRARTRRGAREKARVTFHLTCFSAWMGMMCRCRSWVCHKACHCMRTSYAAENSPSACLGPYRARRRRNARKRR